MKNIYSDSAAVEKLAKKSYGIPDFLMMENASTAIKNLILTLTENSEAESQIFIFCGKGNNGGDGLALARMLMNHCKVHLYCPVVPTPTEAAIQYNMCHQLGLTFYEKSIFLEKLKSSDSNKTFVVDCLYGTGFHGELDKDTADFMNEINKASATKIACDISSGLYFNADYTVTMGTEKLKLFSDKAKAVSGKIILAELGIPSDKFENPETDEKSILPSAVLLEKTDMNLPFRTNKAAHKGTYGHTAVFAGEKAGAGIVAAEAALHFGSGLTTLVKTEKSNLEQFKINPELMLSDSIPAKANAVLLGSGLGELSDKTEKQLIDWAENTENPSVVLDADIFSCDKLTTFLEKLNSIKNIEIILTPHLLEFNRLIAKVLSAHPEINFSEDYSVKSLADNCEAKIKAGQIITQLFPKTAVILKSANTFIFDKDNVYICSEGAQSLAKGGSGDVLAGMTAALLAQKYTVKEGAITAVMAHALASRTNGDGTQYDLSPQKLIQNTTQLYNL